MQSFTLIHRQQSCTILCCLVVAVSNQSWSTELRRRVQSAETDKQREREREREIYINNWSAPGTACAHCARSGNRQTADSSSRLKGDTDWKSYCCRNRRRKCQEGRQKRSPGSAHTVVCDLFTSVLLTNPQYSHARFTNDTHLKNYLTYFNNKIIFNFVC